MELQWTCEGPTDATKNLTQIDVLLEGNHAVSYNCCTYKTVVSIKAAKLAEQTERQLSGVRVGVG